MKLGEVIETSNSDQNTCKQFSKQCSERGNTVCVYNDLSLSVYRFYDTNANSSNKAWPH